MSAFGDQELFTRARRAFGANDQRLANRAALFFEARDLLRQLVAPRDETVAECIRFLHFALGALTPAFELALMFGGATRVDLRGLERGRRLDTPLLRLLHLRAHRLGF